MTVHESSIPFEFDGSVCPPLSKAARMYSALKAFVGYPRRSLAKDLGSISRFDLASRFDHREILITE